MELRITIRQQRMFNRQNQEIYWQGTNPSDLNPVQGQLPAGDPRRWPQYPGWIDVTNQVSDLHKLKLTWSDQRNNDGELTGETQIKKGTSGVLTFEGEAYRLIRKWLIEDVSAPINGVEAIIEHKGVGRYTGYCIKYSDIGWCEGDICTIDLNLKQMDERVACIKSTMIADNHKGWFPNKGEYIASGKKHPRFAYCKEQSPGMLSAIWYILGTLFGSMYPIIIMLGTIYNTIAAIIKGIEAAVNAIISIVGGQPKNWGIDFITWNDLTNFWGAVMTESAGCGRLHPAPLIRDYIQNVCDKCGIAVNAQSAPLFFAPNTEWRSSDPNVGNKGVYSGWNPYYNACYYHPQVKRGIRRYDRWDWIRSTKSLNTTDYWIPDNAPVMTLDMFLNQISPVFNAQWMVRNGTLYINRKDWFTEAQPLFDFRKNGKDRDKILEGVCFENTERKYPAWVKGLWATDQSDMCGSESAGANGTGQANGLYEYENIEDNPAYEGVDDKTVSAFGFARFRFDGVGGDYVYDAAQMVYNAGITSHIIPGSRAAYEDLMDSVVGMIDADTDYAVLMSGETCALPKIIIYDGQGMDNARAWRGFKAGPTQVAQEPEPATNSYYNKGRPTPGGQPTAGRSWRHFHEPDTTVSGSKLLFKNQRPYNYEVYRGMGIPILGSSSPVANHSALLVNYPMYFEPNFRGTLWDRFHWIDDPRRNITLNRNWRVKIELCPENMNILKVFNDANGININQPVLLDHGFHNEGRIREIEVSYDPGDTYGRYIELRGTL